MKHQSENNRQSSAQADTTENFNPVKGEMALWTAVITQALMDAGSESKKAEAQHEKARAIRWLLGGSDDFITVCLNAGLDPDYVRGQAKTAIAGGCNWRNGLQEQRQARRMNRLEAAKAEKAPLEKKSLTPMQIHSNTIAVYPRTVRIPQTPITQIAPMRMAG